MNRTAGAVLAALLSFWIAPAIAMEDQSSGVAPSPRVLTVQEAVRMAVARAPEIALASSQVERARESLREAQASNRPQIVAGTGLAYNNGFPLSIEGSAPSAFQIGLSLPILSKRNRNLIREAEEGISSSRIGQEAVRNEIAARTALLYLEVNSARRLAGIWLQRVENSNRDLSIQESLLEAGKGKPLDVTLARTAEAAARQQQLVAEEQLRLADLELRQLTGLSMAEQFQTEEIRISLEFPGNRLEALTNKAFETYPEIRQAESGLRIREFHVEAEKGGKYPRLEFVTQYALFTRFNNYEDYFRTFQRNNYLVGLSIQVPLFDGFLSNSKVAQGKLEISEARLKLDRLKAELKMNIERAASAVRITAGAAQLARKELDAAREGLAVSQSLLEIGRISPKELLAAQNLVREKEIVVVEAEKTSVQRQVEILRLTGGLTALYE
jgi:outer membrane protein